MKTELHTVTLPIEDYTELISRPAITKEEYDAFAIKTEFIDTRTTNVIVPLDWYYFERVNEVIVKERASEREIRFYKPSAILGLSNFTTEELEKELAKRKGEENEI